jgi:hypothetical protein
MAFSLAFGSSRPVCLFHYSDWDDIEMCIDFYVQLLAYGDFTKLNIPEGDQGGELDPHGAFGAGNPIGGNVTTNVTPSGDELNVGEWMQFISSNQCVTMH